MLLDDTVKLLFPGLEDSLVLEANCRQSFSNHLDEGRISMPGVEVRLWVSEAVSALSLPFSPPLLVSELLAFIGLLTLLLLLQFQRLF